MRWIKLVLAAVVMLSVLNLGTAPLVRADGGAATSESVTISGIVLARRQVVIDPAHMIIQIFSNTDANITPEVTLGSATGPAVKPDAALIEQYQRLASQLQSGATGLVYQPTVIERMHSASVNSAPLPPYGVFNLMLQLNRTGGRVESGGLTAPARLWPWLSQ